MAIILKKATYDTKGVIIFTHKEYIYLEDLDTSIRSHIRTPHIWIRLILEKWIFGSLREKIIKKIKEKYLIGIHWGFLHENVNSKEWVDFHMAANGTVTFVNETYRIPLSSANFTSSSFRFEKNADKFYDVVCVSRAAKFKKIDEFLKTIRKLYDDGKFIKVCLIVPSARNESSKSYYTTLIKDYENKFSYSERQNFILIKIDPDLGALGVSHNFISFIYKHSKTFALFSEYEGESRVIKEAQKSGLLVVVNKNLKGGGKDYLNDENSVQFDSYENAHIAILQCIEKSSKYQEKFDNAGNNEIDEEHSIIEMIRHLNNIYIMKNLDFDGKIDMVDNLARRLPSHFYDPEYTWMTQRNWKNGWSDIESILMLRRFYKFTKEGVSND